MVKLLRNSICSEGTWTSYSSNFIVYTCPHGFPLRASDFVREVTEEQQAHVVRYHQGYIDHTSECAQREWRCCTTGDGRSHRWSGWPGAYCQDCGCEDKNEVCLGLDCGCPCHDQFWEDYAKEVGDGV